MSGITEIFVRSFGYLSIYPRGQIISSAFQARKKVISASYFFFIGTGKLTADQNSKEGIVWMWRKKIKSNVNVGDSGERDNRINVPFTRKKSSGPICDCVTSPVSCFKNIRKYATDLVAMINSQALESGEGFQFVICGDTGDLL